jgi:hypothetical protein
MPRGATENRWRFGFEGRSSRALHAAIGAGQCQSQCQLSSASGPKAGALDHKAFGSATISTSSAINLSLFLTLVPNRNLEAIYYKAPYPTTG